MKRYKIAAWLMIIHGGFMEIGGVLCALPALILGSGKFAFCRVQRTPMRFRADAVQSTTDALKQCIFSYSRGFITTV